MRLKILTPAKVKSYIHEQHPGRRVSSEYLMALEARVQLMIEKSLAMPQNRKQVKDLPL